MEEFDFSLLDQPVSNDEIKEALFTMVVLKHKVSMGFMHFFYQNQWSVVGSSLCLMVRGIFGGEELSHKINSTGIVLILKVDHPESLSQFRPISLCNVRYKIITKVVANRLKIIMPKLIGPMQSSFVLGRHITDNIIIAQEALHSMRNKKGKVGWMAIKVDLEKAYDRLN